MFHGFQNSMLLGGHYDQRQLKKSHQYHNEILWVFVKSMQCKLPCNENFVVLEKACGWKQESYDAHPTTRMQRFLKYNLYIHSYIINVVTMHKRGTAAPCCTYNRYSSSSYEPIFVKIWGGSMSLQFFGSWAWNGSYVFVNSGWCDKSIYGAYHSCQFLAPHTT